MTSSATTPSMVLEARPQGYRALLVAIWRSRDLIATLARKDFVVRYRRASLGLLWAVGLPAMQATVLVIVFSRVVRIQTTGPYPVVVFSAMAAWSFFAGVMGAGTTAIVDNSALTSRIYFPRAVLPIVAVGSSLYGFVVTVAILIGLSLGFRSGAGVSLLLLFPGAIMLVSLALGFALVISALHVYFRDLRFIVQASLIAWFYLTPIFYPLSLTGGALGHVIEANPMTGVVEVFRSATVGADASVGLTVGISLAWIAVLLTLGLYLQRRYDRLFTDLL